MADTQGMCIAGIDLVGIGLPLQTTTQLVVTEGRYRGHSATMETGYENRAA